MLTMNEFKELLEGTSRPAVESRPNLSAIMRDGRRLRWRRRAGAGTLAAACLIAIAVPVSAQIGDDGVAGGTPSSSGDGRTTVEPTVEPTGPPPCSEWLCLGDGEPAEPLGAVIDTGDRVVDVPVRLFAERELIEDPQGDENVHAATLKAGYRSFTTGELLSSWWGVVPDYPFPQQLPLPMAYSAGGGPWVLFGAVTDPNATDVVAVDADGSPIEVGFSDDEVAPGIRVFWASGSMADSDLMKVEFRVLDGSGETLAACTVGDCGGTA